MAHAEYSTDKQIMLLKRQKPQKNKRLPYYFWSSGKIYCIHTALVPIRLP